MIRPAGAPQPVAHVITRLDVGGAQATVAAIVEGLDRSRWTPVVVTGPDDGDAGADLPMRRRLHEAGIEVVDVASLHRSIGPGEVAAVRELRAVLAGLRPAVVHTHSSKAGVLGRLAVDMCDGTAVVHTVHGWSFHEGQARPVVAAITALERRLARRCHRLVVVCEHDRELGLAHGIGTPDQYRLIRSGLDTASIPPPRPLLSRESDRIPVGFPRQSGSGQPVFAARLAARARLGVDDGAPVVMWGGRFAPQKDPTTLVDVIATVHDRRPDVRFVLVGTGPQLGVVARRVDALGLSGFVSLTGIRPDLCELWPAADVALSTSRWEGLPRTAVEAALAGVPLVATRAGGTAELAAWGVAISVREPGDIVGLARDVLATLSAPPPRLHETRRRAMAVEFDLATMVARTDALYDELIVHRAAA